MPPAVARWIDIDDLETETVVYQLLHPHPPWLPSTPSVICAARRRVGGHSLEIIRLPDDLDPPVGDDVRVPRIWLRNRIRDSNSIASTQPVLLSVGRGIEFNDVADCRFENL